MMNEQLRHNLIKSNIQADNKVNQSKKDIKNLKNKDFIKKYVEDVDISEYPELINNINQILNKENVKNTIFLELNSHKGNNNDNLINVLNKVNKNLEEKKLNEGQAIIDSLNSINNRLTGIYIKHYSDIIKRYIVLKFAVPIDNN